MKTLDKARRFLYLPPRLPTSVCVEVTNVCNLNCQFCKRHKLLEDGLIQERHISVDEFGVLLSKLRGVGKLHLQGFGESFLHPDIFTIIDMAKKAGHETEITTNGYWLSPSHKTLMQKILDSNLDNIRISIDDIEGNPEDGHALDIGKNLETLRYVVKHKGTKDIAVNAVLTSSNAKTIQHTIDTLNGIGLLVDVTMVEAQECNTSPLTPVQEYRLLKSLTGNHNSFYKRQKGIMRFAYRGWTKCPKILVEAYVKMNGDVVPCNCGLYRHTMGNLFSESLDTIWSEKFRKFRNNPMQKNRFCQKCTQFQQLWKAD